MRRAIELACSAAVFVCALGYAASEGTTEAREKIKQCIEKEGEEYIEAREWLIEHPEALDLLDEDSWKHRWVKRICQGWTEHGDLYKQRIRGLESAEMGAKRFVRVAPPRPYPWRGTSPGFTETSLCLS